MVQSHLRNISFVLSIGLGGIHAVCQTPMKPDESYTRSLIVRSQNDTTSSCWVLARADATAGGPGQWHFLQQRRCPVSTKTSIREAGLTASSSHIPGVHTVPLIRAGDQIVVEDHSSLVAASFRARALDSACAGESLRVRLSFAATVIRVEAVGPGTALLTRESGMHP